MIVYIFIIRGAVEIENLVFFVKKMIKKNRMKGVNYVKFVSCGL